MLYKIYIAVVIKIKTLLVQECRRVGALDIEAHAARTMLFLLLRCYRLFAA